MRLNDIAQEKGASNWLTVLPIIEQNFNLNKQQFLDAIRLRYGWTIPNLPTYCSCGSKFDVQHSLNCKKGGFVTFRHNALRDLTANLLKEVCEDVAVEPSILNLTGETFTQKTAKTGDESKPDICARGFWISGERALLDVRVFDPNASRDENQDIAQCYEKNEN